MITVDTFQLAADFKSISVELTSSLPENFLTFDVYLGDDYLVPTPIDLSSKVIGNSNPIFTITLADLGLDATDTIKGLVFMHATTTSEEKEAALLNLYYVDLTLAKMIITQNAANGFKDIETIYLLCRAIETFLLSGRFEEALNAYDRVIAMVQDNSHYMVTTDLDPNDAGSGEWIKNGTYIIG